MENINAYDQKSFEQQFKKTYTFELMNQKFDCISFEKFYENYRLPTPRHHESLRKASAVPFYYLQFLDQSCQIVDLGCGRNFFKPYFSNLHGIGAENQPHQFFGDQYGYVDDDFYTKHRSTFNSVFSINALHFNPLDNLQDIFVKFVNLVKPGGRGFLALNTTRMIERSTSFESWDQKSLDHWIRNQFDNAPCKKILVFDVDLSVRNAGMDGNIRIVFEK